ncbi:hypothetical protein HON01_11000, partial [Candidatus Woesearchaeota archaeon]|nr:hypothetical protein [Candidatus Woesearchaeota archaeon]
MEEIGELTAELTENIQRTVSGHDVGLHFHSLSELILGPKLKKSYDKNKAVSLAEKFDSVSFLLNGMRDNLFFKELVGGKDLDLSNDSELIKFLITPDRGIPYATVRDVLVNN